MNISENTMIAFVAQLIDAHMQNCDNDSVPPNDRIPHIISESDKASSDISSVMNRGDTLFVDLENGDQFTIVISKVA